MTINKPIKAQIEISTETIFPSSVSTSASVSTSSGIPVTIFQSKTNSLNNLHAITTTTNNLTSNPSAAIKPIQENTSTTHDNHIINSLKEINNTTATQISNYTTTPYTQKADLTLLTHKNKTNKSTSKTKASNLNINKIESNVMTDNMSNNMQNSLLSAVPSSVIDLESMDLHQNSKWTDTEVRKILDYLSVTENFQKYCKEKKTKTYNKLAEILATKNSAQIKNKLSSLESSYRRVKTKYQNFLQNFNPKNSEQIRLCKDNVLKEFPFFFDMDEIFRIKLHNVKLDSTPSTSTIDKINNYNSHLQNNKETETIDLGSTTTANNILTSFLDMESIQKLIKKNGEDDRNNEDMPSSSEADSIRDFVNIEDTTAKQISGIPINSNLLTLNHAVSTKNGRKRALHDTDILEITSNAKKLIDVYKESEEKRLKFQQEYEEKKLLLKKFLAEKKWENKFAIEKQKLEIQKQHNLDMRTLKERELNLEESKQKIEREKLELEKVHLNLQIKLYEDKLINDFHSNNDINHGMNSTLATINNMNSLNSVQVLQNTNNLKIDNPKK